MKALMGFNHIAKQVCVGSSAIVSIIVYSLLQKPYLRAGLRKELIWQFSSTASTTACRNGSWYQCDMLWC